MALTTEESLAAVRTMEQEVTRTKENVAVTFQTYDTALKLHQDAELRLKEARRVLLEVIGEEANAISEELPSY
jgi:hypothetical protein